MRVTNNMLIGDMGYNLNKSLNRLQMLQYQNSTGKKFRLPSDDPIGVSKSLKFRTDRSKIQQYQRNVDDASSWMKESETAINEIDKIFERANQLAVQASNGINDIEDLEKIKAEVDELRESIFKIANTTYGDRYIFSGYQTDKPLLGKDKDGNIVYELDVNIDDIFNYNTGVSENVNVNAVGNTIFGIKGKEVKENFDKDITKVEGKINAMNKDTSFDEMKEILKELNQTLKNAGVKEFDIENILGKDVLKTDLEDLISNSEAQMGTPGSNANVQTAIDEARQVLQNEESSEKDLFEASQKLNEVLNNETGYNAEDLIGSVISDLDQHIVTEKPNVDALDDDEIFYDKGIKAGNKPYVIEMFEDFGERLAKGEDVDATIKDIQKSKDNLLSRVAEVGARSNRLKITEEKLKSQELNIRELLSGVEDVSLPEVYMQFMLEMNVYNASLSVGSQVIQPTLADFIR